MSIAGLSRWIDEFPTNATADPEAQLWHRVAKISEENGEAIKALIGLIGKNPRRGVTHDVDDLIKELLDVAVTALGAVEHVLGNSGMAMDLLDEHVQRVCDRAGVSD